MMSSSTEISTKERFRRPMFFLFVCLFLLWAYYLFSQILIYALWFATGNEYPGGFFSLRQECEVIPEFAFFVFKAHLLIHSLNGVFCLYLLHRNYVIVSLILLVLIPYLAAVILTYGFMCPVSAIKPFRLSN